jgi:FkbM family methyltransferase
VSDDRQLRWYAENIDPAGAFCVDVGANIGDVSQLFFDRGDQRTRVLSVEPVAPNVDALRKRIAAAATSRWTVERGAVSDRTGPITLQARRDDKTGWNAMVCANPPPTEHLEVEAFRLPELAPDAEIVKLDVEGHEYAILDDALGRMPSVRTWAIELHMVEDRPLPPLLQRFEAEGFEVVAATARRRDPRGPWVNLVVPPTLTWKSIPVARRRRGASDFKMLHVLARR